MWRHIPSFHPAPLSAGSAMRAVRSASNQNGLRAASSAHMMFHQLVDAHERIGQATGLHAAQHAANTQQLYPRPSSAK